MRNTLGHSIPQVSSSIKSDHGWSNHDTVAFRNPVFSWFVIGKSNLWSEVIMASIDSQVLLLLCSWSRRKYVLPLSLPHNKPATLPQVKLFHSNLHISSPMHHLPQSSYLPLDFYDIFPSLAGLCPVFLSAVVNKYRHSSCGNGLHLAGWLVAGK